MLVRSGVKMLLLLAGMAMSGLAVSFSAAAETQAKKVWAIPKPESLDRTPPSSREDTKLKAEMRQPPNSLFDSRTEFIVGGNTAARGEFPEYGAVLVDGDDGYLYFICGGSLISANKMLTAAHCSYPYYSWQLYAVPGVYKPSEVSSSDIIPVSSVVEHSDYSNTSLVNDISILTLSSSSSKTRVKIFGGTHTLSGDQGTVIGLGKLDSHLSTPNTLQKVNLPIVSNHACSQAWHGFSIPGSMLCAGGTASGGIGACSGDSGGPLFTSVNGQKTQVGVVSWGHENCAEPGYYDVYTRTSKFVSFIQTYAPKTQFVYKPVNIAPVLSLLLDE